jgi:amino acid transporter
MAESARQQMPTETELKKDALGVVSAVMQAITHIAPAIAALFFTQFLVTLAGVTAPLAYVIAAAIVLMLGNTLVQFSKHLPSAGGYYTYVSRSLGSRMGFLTSWMYILYSPIVGGPLLGMFGFIVAGELNAAYSINVPWLWWVTILVGAPIIAFLQYRGIELSARTMVIAGSIEIVIVLALAVSGFANPGPGGFSFAVFNPGNITAISGFSLGVVLGVQGLTGWEAAAPLAEETKDPKRNVPRSVMISIVILGVLLVFTYWGVITGFGVNNLSALTGSSDLPGLALAHKLWGDAWWLILLAFMSSVLGACLATANVGTRMWYGMGRNGSFPKLFAKVHPKYKTPTNAIYAQLAFSLITGIGGGIWFQPNVSFFFLVGLIVVLGVSFVYLAANVGVIRYYLTERRSEFNLLTHLIFPVASSLVLIYALAESFPPFCPAVNCPGAPYNSAPYVDGGWLVIGILILVYYHVQKRDGWIRSAGAILGENEAELAHEPRAPVVG